MLFAALGFCLAEFVAGCKSGDDETSTTSSTAPTAFALTARVTGTGSGVITSSPTGISCGSDCTENFATGTSVELFVSFSSPSVFTGWSESCSGTSSTCTVTMNGNRGAAAQFDNPTVAPQVRH
jgi:hypothetical protein